MTSDSAPCDRRCYRFGPYVADPRTRLLWRNSALVPLTPKAFEILATLIENRDRVVEKDELLDRIWAKTAVEENTLTRHISTLRKALDELPGHHQYILTVPGHGYQFVADVVELPDRPETLRHAVELDRHALANGRAPAATYDRAGETVTLPANLPRQMPRSAAAIGLALAAVSGLGVLLSLAINRAAAPSGPGVLRQVTFQSGLQREPAFSPDGRFVAYTSSGDGNSDLWVQSITEPSPLRLTSSAAEDSQPDWSPDGQWVVFRSERDGGGLYIVPVRRGTERKIASFGYRPRWSPDGSLILFSSSGHEGGTPKFYIVGADGGVPRPVRPDVVEELSALSAAWKPGGRDVSFWGRNRATGWTFLTVSFGEEPPRRSAVSPDVQQRIDGAGLTLARFVWSRSGRYLFFEGQARGARNLWRVTVDPATLAWVGGPDRLTTGTGEDADMAVSPDGTRLIFSARSARTRLWSFPFNPATGQLTGEGQPLTSGGAGELDADALTDGSKLVYSAVRAGRQELWERSIADRRDRLMIASTEWARTRPHWSPDGTRIAYSRRRAGANMADAVVAVLTVHDGEERLVTRPGDTTLVPSDWSTDGNRLLGGCSQSRERPVGTCVLDMSVGPASQPRVQVLAADPKRNLFEQRFSPDQRWISFIAVSSVDAGVSTIFVMPASGGAWRAITEGFAYDDKPHWAPDGRTIYFASNRNGLFNIWGRRFDPASGTVVGAPFPVTAFQSAGQTLATQLSRMQFAVTSNRLFLPITDTSGELWMLENVEPR